MTKIPCFIPLLYIFLFTQSVSSQCLHDQKTFLLELKHNLTFDTETNTDKLEGWNESNDCCQWSGIECDISTGQVIGLDLSWKGINTSLNSSTLFNLNTLQKLDLSGNYIGTIPQEISKLSQLTYLNLSYGAYTGQVPIEISKLVKLVVLDLSIPSMSSSMENPNLAIIIQNLTNLSELYIDQTDVSIIGNKWAQALSSSLPNLQVLSMKFCGLTGIVHNSLSKLKNLSVIRFDNNHINGSIPDYFGGFKNLTVLTLSQCDLTGVVPKSIFQVPTLRILDLSFNQNLQGSFPEFYENGSFEELVLAHSSFSGVIPSSISTLKRLRTIDLTMCSLHGSIPSSIGSISLLEHLDLSYNQFSGPIPSFSSNNKLTYLALNANNFKDFISTTEWGKLPNLEYFLQKTI